MASPATAVWQGLGPEVEQAPEMEQAVQPPVESRFEILPQPRTPPAPRERLEQEWGPEPRGFVYDGARCGRALRSGLSQRAACRGPLPTEELGLFIKDVDNSLLRRPSNPEGKTNWRRKVQFGVGALIVVAVLFGPRAWLRQSGYRIAEMTEQRAEMMEISDQLRVRQAQLSDLRRIGELAAARGFVAPPPQNYSWQDRGIAPAEDNAALARSIEPERPVAGAIFD